MEELIKNFSDNSLCRCKTGPAGIICAEKIRHGNEGTCGKVVSGRGCNDDELWGAPGARPLLPRPQASSGCDAGLRNTYCSSEDPPRSSMIV